jgi:hypothetical protein
MNLRLRVIYLLAKALRMPIRVADDYWLTRSGSSTTGSLQGEHVS